MAARNARSACGEEDGGKGVPHDGVRQVREFCGEVFVCMDGVPVTAVPTILLNNCINYCKSDCYEHKIARWISESDFVL